MKRSWIIGGWLVARDVARRDHLWGSTPRPSPESLDDLLVYVAFGVILGGRIGYVFFYAFQDFLANPLFLLRINEGGMSFHGGLLGVMIAALTQLYREQGRYLERMYKWSVRVGIDSIRAHVVEDAARRRALYERFVISQKVAQIDPFPLTEL